MVTHMQTSVWKEIDSNKIQTCPANLYIVSLYIGPRNADLANFEPPSLPE